MYMFHALSFVQVICNSTISYKFWIQLDLWCIDCCIYIDYTYTSCMKGIARYAIHHIRRHAARKVATLVGMGFTEQQATVPWHHWVSQFYGGVPIWCPIKKKGPCGFCGKEVGWCSWLMFLFCKWSSLLVYLRDKKRAVGGGTMFRMGRLMWKNYRSIVYLFIGSFFQCQRALLCIDDQHTPQWSGGSWL